MRIEHYLAAAAGRPQDAVHFYIYVLIIGES